MDYEQFKIKTFTHWDLFLHNQQYPYLGRCYASARRQDALQVRDMRGSERDELFETVIPAWDRTVIKLFKRTWPNVACLGNTWRHLHWHLIPRYDSPIEAYGLRFEDPNPKGNYAPYPKKEVPLETLLQIRDEFKRELGV